MKVKVLNSGSTYDAYWDLAEKYTNNILRFEQGRTPCVGEVLDLIEYAKHPDPDFEDVLAICRDKHNYIIIISKEGVEDIKEESLLDKVFQNHVEVDFRGGLKGIVVSDIIYNTNRKTIIPVIADKNQFDLGLKNILNNNRDIIKATLNGEVIYKREQEKWSEWKLIKNPRYRTYYRAKGKRVQVKVKGFKTVVGEARCSTEDAFRLKKGMDIAYNRAIINLYQKKLDELLK